MVKRVFAVKNSTSRSDGMVREDGKVNSRADKIVNKMLGIETKGHIVEFANTSRDSNAFGGYVNEQLVTVKPQLTP